MSETANRASPADAAVIPAGYEDVPHEVVRLRARRRAIARTMSTAAQVPCLTADMQMDLTAVLAARAEFNEDAPPEAKLSVSAFIGRTAIQTLVEFPSLNATYTTTRSCSGRPSTSPSPSTHPVA